MCFSAQASFLTSGLLLAIGCISVSKTKKNKHLLFATIPFIFALQQMIEGFNWVSLENFRPNLFGITIVYPIFFSYAYLFFAYLLWPVYIPLSLAMIEKKKKVTSKMYVFLFQGALSTGYLCFYIFNHNMIGHIVNCSISYGFAPMTKIDMAFTPFYFIATIAPFFFSTVEYMWTIGVAAIVSAIVAAIFYSYAFTSVWCFFAAILSIMVVWLIEKIK